MSGANQIQKFAQVNREDQLAPLSAIGTEFHQRSLTLITAVNSPAGIMPATIFGTDFIIDAASPAGALQGPTAVEMCQYFQTLTTAQEGQRGLNPAAIGSRFEIVIENADPNPAGRTIVLGVGFTPGGIALLPQTTYLASFELTSLGPGALQTWDLFMLIPTTGPGGAPAGVSSFTNSANSQLAPFLNPPVARTGNVVAAVNDYVAADIGVAASVVSGIPTGDLQTTLDAKVTLRNAAGAIGGGATGIKDLLVATAAGDNYIPSGLVNSAQAGSMEVGPLGLAGNVVQTANGNLIEARGGTATVPLNSYFSALGGVADPVSLNFAMYTSSVTAPAFGQAALTPQYGVRSILPGGLVPSNVDTGGAYHFVGQTPLGVNSFAVNSAGEVKFVATAGPQAANISQDANGYISLIASNRDLKRNIEHLRGTEFIFKVPARSFIYKSDVSERVRVGAIVEEVMEAGASQAYFCHKSKFDQKLGTNVEDDSKPSDLNDRALFWALVDQFQKMHAEIEQLKKRTAEKPKSAKKETPSM